VVALALKMPVYKLQQSFWNNEVQYYRSCCLGWEVNFSWNPLWTTCKYILRQ